MDAAEDSVAAERIECLAGVAEDEEYEYDVPDPSQIGQLKSNNLGLFFFFFFFFGFFFQGSSILRDLQVHVQGQLGRSLAIGDQLVFQRI